MEQDSKGKKVLKFKKGEFLFKQNDLTKDLYIVKSGKVRVFKIEGGIEIDLDQIAPGGIIGEIAAIDNGPRSASVVALEDTEVFVISQEEFKKLSEKIPDWLKKICAILAGRLRETDAKIDRNLEKDETLNIASALFLVSSTDIFKTTQEGLEANSKILEDEIMDITGVKYSELSSALNNLEKKEGIIKFEKGKIIIKDIKKLEQISNPILNPANFSPQI